MMFPESTELLENGIDRRAARLDYIDKNEFMVIGNQGSTVRKP